MHLDLVDHLRCPNPHPDITGGVALVCVKDDVDGRVLHEAMLGCAVCHVRFSVANGIGWFGRGPLPAIVPPPSSGTDGSQLVRLAALLNLDGPGGFVLLDESTAAHAAAIADMFEVAVVIATAVPLASAHPMVSVLAGLGDALPLAPLTLRGAALGALPTPGRLAAAARALMPNGRLVAPVECDPPPAVSVLVRDDRHWVAEPRAEPVSLRRAPPPPLPRTPDR